MANKEIETYDVEIKCWVTVEATSEEEAEEKAMDKLIDDFDLIDFSFEVI